MTGILHTYIPNRVIDSDGISDGAAFDFYVTGTLTHAAIYTSASLATTHANPFTVAAGAAVPDIYLDPTVTYRRIITFADGSTQDTDPYTGLSAGGINAARGGSVDDYLNYYAPSGLSAATAFDSATYSFTGADNHAALQAWINDLQTNGGRGTIGEGVYVIDSPLTISGTGHLMIEGAGSMTTGIDAATALSDFHGTVIVNPNGQALVWGDDADPFPTRRISIANITFAGNTCATALTVTFSGDGTGAAGYAMVEDGTVVGVFVTAAGTGYTSATVAFAGGGGTGAAGTVALSGTGVSSVTMTANGSGYTTDTAVAEFAGVVDHSRFNSVTIAQLGYGSGLKLHSAWFNSTQDITCINVPGKKASNTFYGGTYGIKVAHGTAIDGGPIGFDNALTMSFQFGTIVGRLQYSNSTLQTQAITFRESYFQYGMIGIALKTKAWQIILDNCHPEHNLISGHVGCDARIVKIRGGASQETTGTLGSWYIGKLLQGADANQRQASSVHFDGHYFNNPNISPITVDVGSSNVKGVMVTQCLFRITASTVTKLVNVTGGTLPAGSGVFFGNQFTADSYEASHAGTLTTIGTSRANLDQCAFLADIDGRTYTRLNFDSVYSGSNLLTLKDGKSGTEHSFWIDGGTGTYRYKAGVPAGGLEGNPVLLGYTDTAANIASAAAAVNTTGKFATKQVFDTTNHRLMVASGSNATDAWYVADGSASVTPA